MSFFAAPPILETTVFTRLPDHFRNARPTTWANANRQGRAIDSFLEGLTVLDQYAGARMPIHVIWPKTRYLQPKLRTVIDELLRMTETQAELFTPWSH
ncbi:MAG: hypothetical protein ACRESJ_20580 [Pseudomonas sp.]|uniref:hypothetical protein n=1 Tax=Pseudomonas sp. TaxID=306 RepID=UPI003D6EBCDF